MHDVGKFALEIIWLYNRRMITQIKVIRVRRSSCEIVSERHDF